MRRDEDVPGLAVRFAVIEQPLNARLMQLQPHDHGHVTADQTGHDGKHQVKRADVLVVRGTEPANQKARLVIVMRVRVACHDL